ncbi:MAG: FAD-binding oxidoreductase [Gammaproteobacteria bacterium]|nr:FAD-binding oxidoreductase [Gammaproteobacteria bacterium]
MKHNTSHFSPINLSSPVTFNDSLPESTDVVIVGGGIIGIATALQLASRGQQVVVLEKGRVAGEQSSRNWGWIRQTGRDAGELPLMMESLEHWKALASATGENTLAFSEQGVLYLASTQKSLDKFEAFSQLAKSHGLVSTVLTSDEVSKKLPVGSQRWLGGLHTVSDGRAEPWFAVPALARAAQREGVKIIENCAASAVDTTAGTVSGVQCEKGTINCSQVLLAGGAWTSLLARRSGISLPQLSVKSTVMRVENLPACCDTNAADERIAFCRRADGAHTVALSDYHEFYIGPDAFRHLGRYRQAIKTAKRETRYRLTSPAGYPDAWGTARRWTTADESPFVKNRMLDPTPAPTVATEMLRRLQVRFPDCRDLTITHLWAGMIDTMPDFVPVLDESTVPGLYLATGFSGHGFGIGPGAGRVMADLMCRNEIGHDLSRFRFSRFTDGSELVLGPH